MTIFYILGGVTSLALFVYLFVALLTPVCVARDERRSIAIPDVFRKALTGYQAECLQHEARAAGPIE